jgi:hypothetical protein
MAGHFLMWWNQFVVGAVQLSRLSSQASEWITLLDLSVAKHRGVMSITQDVSFKPIRVNFTPLDRSFLLAFFVSLYRANRTVGERR